MKLKSKLFLSLLLVFFISLAGVFAVFPFDRIIEFGKENYFILAIVIASYFILIILVYIILARSISKPIKKLNDAILIIDDEKTEKLKDLTYKKRDVIGKLIQTVLALHMKLRMDFNFITMLMRGKYDPDYVPEDEGMIGTGLIDLRDKLVITEKEKKYIEEENRKTEWYQTGVTEFTTLLQQNFETTHDMSFTAVKKLVKHLEVEQGGIFILEKTDDKEVLVLESAYAYDKKKLLNTEIEIGESLIGKCAKEREIIKIEDLPEGYTYIGSGLGENTPKTLILVPLIYENNLFGVIELASLKNIPEYKVAFIEVIGERIASEISNIQSRVLSKKLTEDFKDQAESFSEKEKEAEKIIADLLEKQKEFDNIEKENNSIINAYQSMTVMIFFDPEGKLNKSNELGNKLFQTEGKEDINIKELLDLDEEVWTKITEGKTQRITKIFDEENISIPGSVTPIFNNEGNIEKILYIAVSDMILSL